MDHDANYKTALELASTARYKEAREKLQELLLDRPGHIDALILLGKIEYYLRLFASSRSRFETALTYDSGNLAAYFGLEYFKERKKRLFFLSTLALILITFLISFFFSSALLKRDIIQVEKSISLKIDTYASASETMEKEILLKLETLFDQLKEAADSIESDQEEASYRIEALNRQVFEQRSRQTQILADADLLTRMISLEIEELKQRLETLSERSER
jgi:tetratricopeptide (TPR) repeat protein